MDLANKFISLKNSLKPPPSHVPYVVVNGVPAGGNKEGFAVTRLLKFVCMAYKVSLTFK
jgi:hypothetical protein